jgi:hypothetical protein
MRAQPEHEGVPVFSQKLQFTWDWLAGPDAAVTQHVGGAVLDGLGPAMLLGALTLSLCPVRRRAVSLSQTKKPPRLCRNREHGGTSAAR